MPHETLERASGSGTGAATVPPDDPIPARAAPIELAPIGRRPGWRTASRITFHAPASLRSAFVEPVAWMSVEDALHFYICQGPTGRAARLLPCAS